MGLLHNLQFTGRDKRNSRTILVAPAVFCCDAVVSGLFYVLSAARSSAQETCPFEKVPLIQRTALKKSAVNPRSSMRRALPDKAEIFADLLICPSFLSAVCDLLRKICAELKPQFLLSANSLAAGKLHNVKQNAYRCLPPGGNPRCRH